jgi:multidrug resistance efflux pump
VVAGQTLASIADTYGLSGNAISAAALGVSGAELTRDNALVSLGQAVASTKISFEKAQKDYDSAHLNANETLDQAERNAAALQTGTIGVGGTSPSKAQLDLNNYIASQQKQLDAFETSYANQLQSFQSFLANVIDMTDTLLGVSDQKKSLNDSYEYLLSATDSQQKIKADNLLQQLLKYKTWSPDASGTLIERVNELQKVQNLTSNLLSAVKVVLINSVTDATVFPALTLASNRAIIDAYQAQYNGLSAGLVGFLNGAQTFLATYQNERLAREQAVKLAADNAVNTLAQTKISVENGLRAASAGLELAKNAYDAAQKAQEISGSQMDQSIGLASLRLSDAHGGAARLNVTAPFSGVIIARNVEIGSLVSPGANLFIIGDAAHLIIKTDVSVEQHKYLAEGQDIPLVFHGVLSSLSAGPDPVSRLYRVEIVIPVIHPKITLGDIVDVILPGAPLSQNPENTQIVIPYSALRNL